MEGYTMKTIEVNTWVEFDFFNKKSTGFVFEIQDDIAYVEANLIGFLSTYTFPLNELTIKE
tara:strand:+ start:107 stop:289 length:183 start_codon:yes stop_codon:yes gene_type:complete